MKNPAEHIFFHISQLSATQPWLLLPKLVTQNAVSRASDARDNLGISETGMSASVTRQTNVWVLLERARELQLPITSVDVPDIFSKEKLKAELKERTLAAANEVVRVPRESVLGIAQMKDNITLDGIPTHGLLFELLSVAKDVIQRMSGEKVLQNAINKAKQLALSLGWYALCVESEEQRQEKLTELILKLNNPKIIVRVNARAFFDVAETFSTVFGKLQEKSAKGDVVRPKIFVEIDAESSQTPFEYLQFLQKITAQYPQFDIRSDLDLGWIEYVARENHLEGTQSAMCIWQLFQMYQPLLQRIGAISLNAYDPEKNDTHGGIDLLDHGVIDYLKILADLGAALRKEKVSDILVVIEPNNLRFQEWLELNRHPFIQKMKNSLLGRIKSPPVRVVSKHFVPPVDVNTLW